MTKKVRDFITALDEAALDEAGFVVVPKQISDDMISAAMEIEDTEHGGIGGYFEDVWEAMIAAAQNTTEQG